MRLIIVPCVIVPSPADKRSDAELIALARGALEFGADGDAFEGLTIELNEAVLQLG